MRHVQVADIMHEIARAGSALLIARLGVGTFRPTRMDQILWADRIRFEIMFWLINLHGPTQLSRTNRIQRGQVVPAQY